MVSLAHILGDRPWLTFLSLFAVTSLALGLLVLFVRWSRRHRERMDKRPLEYLFVHDLIGLAIVLGLVVFVAIASRVTSKEGIPAPDFVLANGLHASTPSGLIPAIKLFTWFGDGVLLTIVGVSVCAVLLTKRRFILAAGWAIALGGGALMNFALKAWFQRPRPTFADATIVSSGWSFPSGHSMGTMVTVGMLVYLTFGAVKATWARGVIVVAALTWTAGMGWSRMVLGAHYLTDVLAGFAAGMVWLAACVSGLEVARRRPV